MPQSTPDFTQNYDQNWPALPAPSSFLKQQEIEDSEKDCSVFEEVKRDDPILDTFCLKDWAIYCHCKSCRNFERSILGSVFDDL